MINHWSNRCAFNLRWTLKTTFTWYTQVLLSHVAIVHLVFFLVCVFVSFFVFLACFKKCTYISSMYRKQTTCFFVFAISQSEDISEQRTFYSIAVPINKTLIVKSRTKDQATNWLLHGCFSRAKLKQWNYFISA